MSERTALLVVLIISCVLVINTQAFIGGFSDIGDIVVTPVAAADALPERAERENTALPPVPFFLDKITATSYYVSRETGSPRLLLQHDPYTELSIASLTKLMTALTVLTYEPDWNATIKVLPTDIKGGSTNHFKVGTEARVSDLWAAMLVGSDNDAAGILARYCAGDEALFVVKMNELSDSYGLSQTVFKEVSGLSSDNKSTAREFAMIARNAFKEPKIKDVLSQSAITVDSSNRTIKIYSTDQKIRYESNSLWSYITGKTGYTVSAGYTAAVLATDDNNQEILAVVLQSSDNTSRSQDIARLLDWAAHQP